jgi:hypothetical protein
MTTGIESLLGSPDCNWVEDQKKDLREKQEDPIKSARAELDKVTVPGGGTQDVGTEYLTSEPGEVGDPGDQQFDPVAGARTSAETGSHLDPTVQLGSKPGDPSGSVLGDLESKIAAMNQQSMSLENDPRMGILPSATGQDMLPPDDQIEVMPGGLRWTEESMADNPAFLDSLQDKLDERAVRSRSWAQTIYRGGGGGEGQAQPVQNQGRIGSTDPVLSTPPEEWGNPTVDVEKPEHYLDDEDELTYPTGYPRMGVGHGGETTMVAPTQPSTRESAEVASAVQLVLEGADPDDVARVLLGD